VCGWGGCGGKLLKNIGGMWRLFVLKRRKISVICPRCGGLMLSYFLILVCGKLLREKIVWRDRMVNMR